MEITTLDALKTFRLESVINQDAITRTITLLGTFPSTSSERREQGIVRIEQRPLRFDDEDDAGMEIFERIRKAETVLANDIYFTLEAWLSDSDSNSAANLMISVICPATDVHIRKYTAQPLRLLTESPSTYTSITLPYILSVPPSRTQWITALLSPPPPPSSPHTTSPTAASHPPEVLLISKPEYVVLPDMKWDTHNADELYLLCIARDGGRLRTLRDLKYKDVKWLEEMRAEVGRVVKGRWGLGRGEVRMYVHYQPSYYHFHVHIVNANHASGHMGMRVGQAHLLEDVIELLKLDAHLPPTSDPIMHRLSFTFGLGREHGLFDALVGVQEGEGGSTQMPGCNE